MTHRTVRPFPVALTATTDCSKNCLCETVTWLEGWIAVDPVPVDAVNAWLDVAIAERFMNAGINDIAALQAAMKKHWQHWYRRMSKIGPVAAQRLQRWLSENKLLFTENLPVIAKPNIRLMAMEADIVPFSGPLAPTSQKQAVPILRPCARG